MRPLVTRWERESDLIEVGQRSISPAISEVYCECKWLNHRGLERGASVEGASALQCKCAYRPPLSSTTATSTMPSIPAPIFPTRPARSTRPRAWMSSISTLTRFLDNRDCKRTFKRPPKPQTCSACRPRHHYGQHHPPMGRLPVETSGARTMHTAVVFPGISI